MAEKSFLQKVKHYRKEIFVVFMAIILVIFMVQNSEDVDFDLVVTDMEVPLIVLILGFTALGAGTVGIYWFLSNRDKKRTIKEMAKELEKKDAEINMVKSLKEE